MVRVCSGDPAAADHALSRTYPASIAWLVLATDGAQRGLDHHIDWTALPSESADQLRGLDHLHRWDHDHDPDGAQLPRGNRHDDKTLVNWTTPRDWPGE